MVFGRHSGNVHAIGVYKDINDAGRGAAAHQEGAEAPRVSLRWAAREGEDGVARIAGADVEFEGAGLPGGLNLEIPGPTRQNPREQFPGGQIGCRGWI